VSIRRDRQKQNTFPLCCAVGQRSTLVPSIHAGSAAVVAVAAIFLANLPLSRGQQIGSAAGSVEEPPVKHGDPGATQVLAAKAPGEGFTATNVTVKMLIQQAFDLRDDQISGGPNWLESENYNVMVNAGEASAIRSGAGGDALQRMTLRSLLVGRFGLAFHRASRTEPMYQLVVAEAGSRLKATTIPEGLPRVLRQEPGRITGWAASMPRLASRLSQQLGRPVIDKTGLAGEYDFTFDYAPYAVNRRIDEPGVADASLPSIFTALQERLGLKLQATETTVEILVIDRVERPSEN
jgi:uncharacterized protein (TIGR03435 family)